MQSTRPGADYVAPGKNINTLWCNLKIGHNLKIGCKLQIVYNLKNN
jgi:hypothetical protein